MTAGVLMATSCTNSLRERNVGFYCTGILFVFYEKDREATQTEWGLKMM